MIEVIAILIAIGVVWNFYDDYKQQHPKKMDLPPKSKKTKKPVKHNTDNDDYSIDNDWFGYSPDLVKLNSFRQYKKDYLDSPKWKTKRKLAIERDGCRCVICGSTNNLEVHHLKYANIPNEPLEDLVTLCGGESGCHQYQHDLLGYPQTYQDYMNWDVLVMKR